MIKTKNDARELINQIDLFGFVNDVKHIRVSFGSIDISRYDDFWIGHSIQKVMQICPSNEDIINFMYKHRGAINNRHEEITVKQVSLM